MGLSSIRGMTWLNSTVRQSPPGPEQASEFMALAASHGVPAAAIGAVTGDSLRVTGQFDIPLDELASVWQSTLPRLFG